VEGEAQIVSLAKYPADLPRGSVTALAARVPPAATGAMGSRATPELKDLNALTCLAALTKISEASSLAPGKSQFALISRPMNSQAEQPEHQLSPSEEGICLHLAHTWGLGISLEQQATFGRNIIKALSSA